MSFPQVIELIDYMVALLGKEQVGVDAKKECCDESIDVQIMGQIVESSFATQSQKAHIAALLHSSADSEEDAQMGSSLKGEVVVQAAVLVPDYSSS